MKQIPDNHSFTMRLRVTQEMTARFFDCEIHPVYSTFSLIAHAEYAARQVILPYLDLTEDAVGSSVELRHIAPAAVGSVVEITATLLSVEGRAITCKISAKNDRGEIAIGTQTQTVLEKNRLRETFASLPRD